ncbi:YceK/YidQ family lipoprotein [Bisgaard Taxon 45]
MCHGPGCLGLGVLRPLSIIDFPFSLVGDTLMLPVKRIQKAVQE